MPFIGHVGRHVYNTSNNHLFYFLCHILYENVSYSSNITHVGLYYNLLRNNCLCGLRRRTAARLETVRQENRNKAHGGRLQPGRQKTRAILRGMCKHEPKRVTRDS